MKLIHHAGKEIPIKIFCLAITKKWESRKDQDRVLLINAIVRLSIHLGNEKSHFLSQIKGKANSISMEILCEQLRHDRIFQTFDREDRNTSTNSLYDENGFDAYGFDINGNSLNWSAFKLNMNDIFYCSDGFDYEGFDRQRKDIFGYKISDGGSLLIYNRDGLDEFGFNRGGFDRNGYLRDEGHSDVDYDCMGRDCDGLDRGGFDKNGFNLDGFDKNGFNQNGVDRDGFDRNGFNRYGFNRDGFNRFGFDKHGFDKYGFRRDGFDMFGFSRNGFDRFGFNRNGFDRFGFNRNGFDRDGFDRDGFDRDGFDRDGFDRDGFDRDGFDRDGFDENQCNRKGFFSDLRLRKDLISSIINQTKKIIARLESRNFNVSFSSNDLYLIEIWCNSELYKDTFNRMCSARMAEKFVYFIFLEKESNSDVEDISIKQITDPSDKQWVDYDLIIKNEIYLDVKNSRVNHPNKPNYSICRSVIGLERSISRLGRIRGERINKLFHWNSLSSTSGRNWYSRHCVKKFKLDRNGQDVIIAGVVSPNINYYGLVNRDRGALDFSQLKNQISLSKNEYPIFIGFSSLDYIDHLISFFKTSFFDFEPLDKNFIPNYLFYISNSFWNIDEYFFKTFKERKFLWNENDEFNPIPLYIVTNTDIPESTSLSNKCLSVLERRLRLTLKSYNKEHINDTSNLIDLPFLYFFLMTDFLESISKEEDINPHLYYKVIYFYQNEEFFKFPMGIYDPLNLIYNLINILCTLYENQSSSNLKNYLKFKFTRNGFLYGRKKDSTRYETILAHCGRCGHYPLIAGQNDRCHICSKLICNNKNGAQTRPNLDPEICSFCCESCSRINTPPSGGGVTGGGVTH
ncbi:hypothetical protein KKF91_16915 [Myxococcota bacterium]|nr:hypothetical protein [Myxococcota bacterium]MBU1432220.1 hypothetical protein [Myxococcota bacterium]MBU1897101.1 hypothetical protein [Myxococcota bacterium]